ncbi:hypothetical protein EJB05_04786, partial [Eragrostis curvula]
VAMPHSLSFLSLSPLNHHTRPDVPAAGDKRRREHGTAQRGAAIKILRAKQERHEPGKQVQDLRTSYWWQFGSVLNPATEQGNNLPTGNGGGVGGRNSTGAAS